MTNDAAKKIIIALTLLLTVTFVGVGIFAWNHYTGDDEPTKKDTASSSEAPTLELGEKPEGSVDDHRKVLTEKATELIKASASASQAYGSHEKTIEALSEAEFGKLPKTFTELFRMEDYFSREKEIEAAAYLALVNLGEFISTLAEESDREIEPINDDRWKNVFVDVEAGVGFVPVSNFVSGGSSFSLEFIYIDGEWIFSPYSFIDSVAAVSAASSVRSAE